MALSSVVPGGSVEVSSTPAPGRRYVLVSFSGAPHSRLWAAAPEAGTPENDGVVT